MLRKPKHCGRGRLQNLQKRLRGHFKIKDSIILEHARRLHGATHESCTRRRRHTSVAIVSGYLLTSHLPAKPCHRVPAEQAAR
jgi:hypothetical protein